MLGQLQRIESRGNAVFLQEIIARQRTHQNLEPAIFIEDDLRDTLPAQHGNEEADEYGLPRSGGTANQRVAGIFAAAAIRVDRVAGVQ